MLVPMVPMTKEYQQGPNSERENDRVGEEDVDDGPRPQSNNPGSLVWMVMVSVVVQDFDDDDVEDEECKEINSWGRLLKTK